MGPRNLDSDILSLRILSVRTGRTLKTAATSAWPPSAFPHPSERGTWLLTEGHIVRDVISCAIRTCDLEASPVMLKL